MKDVSDNNKPKRWTWEEWIEHRMVDEQYVQPFASESFEVNESYIDWQEKKIAYLKQELGSDFSETKEVVSIVTENEELKQRIAELENDFAGYNNFQKEREQTETIAKLRETLLIIASNSEDLDINVVQIYCDMARAALKECFGEDE